MANFASHILFVISSIGSTVVVIVADLFLYPFARYILPHLSYKQNVWVQFIVGSLLTLYIFKEQTIIPVIMAIITYIIVDWKPLFAISISFLMSSAVHIYCMVVITKGWQWMVNAITMIILQKVWMMTIDLYNGRRIKKGEKVRLIHQKTALFEKPPILEYMTYLFSPFGSNSGPIYTYKVQEYTFGVGERPRIKDDSRSHKAARTRFYMTFIWIITTFFSLKYAKVEFYSSPLYVNSPLICKVGLMMFCAFLHTLKYFCAWQSVEAGLYETGVAEADIVGFEEISNLTIIDVLLSNSNSIWLQRWNHTAHVFWKHYLFYPLLDNGVPYFFSYNLIFVFSALWHGFYPVYYMLLPEMIVATTADKLINGMFPDLLTNGNVFVRCLYRFWVWLSMLVPTSTWWYRSADAFIFVRKSQKFLGPILILIVFIVAKIASLFIKVKPRKNKFVTSESQRNVEVSIEKTGLAYDAKKVDENRGKIE